MNYAEVALNLGIAQSFTYHIPDDLIGKLESGHLVRVPFRTAQEAGIVVGLSDEKPDFVTKPILERIDPQPVLTPPQLELAHWLAEKTLTPIGACLWVMLPPGFTPRSDDRFTLVEMGGFGNPPLQQSTSLKEADAAIRLISLLQRRGPLIGKQLTTVMGKDWRKPMKTLLADGIVRAEATLAPPTVQPKTIRNARLILAPEQIDDIAHRLGRESRRANVLEVLWAQPDGMTALDHVLAAAGCSESVVRALEEAGLIDRHSENVLELVVSEGEVRDYIIQARGGGRYIDILNLLAENGGVLDVPIITRETGAKLTHLKRLHDDGLIALGESEIWRDSVAEKNITPDLPPTLTEAQESIWGDIRAHMEWGESGRGVFLMHGVTGSGKTEVYMRAVDLTLKQGRSAIVLVPEIALTAQMVGRFAARFPGQVALVHSTLSPGERFDTWRRARAGELQVIIGARSALFAPLPDVGLIVLDEEHDDSYKQSPPVVPPYYHARHVAIEYMRLSGGTVILGSATPDVGSYFAAEQGNMTLLELPERVLAHRAQIAEQTRNLNVSDARYQPIDGTDAAGLPLPDVQIVDMRQELRAGHTSVFSRALIDGLHEVLDAKQQAILFLNRRGMATFVFCRDCGYIARCPNCDMPLTYHRHGEQLTCHHCGHREDNPIICPECESKRIKYFGRGTELIEKALKEGFPDARVLRWDQDTASRRGAHAEIYEAFAAHKADILVGTQMITKGLDLPLVTLVGIISGDTALGLPDYRAGETTFQLLTQVAGRAGRSPLGGRAILQTYQPDHYAIQAAAEHDYAAFYRRELMYRRELRMPPFTRLARLLFRDPLEDNVMREAKRIAALLRDRIELDDLSATEIIGPVPCFFTKIDKLYRWHILVRSPDPLQLLAKVDAGPLCTVDIDPVDIL
jgi:primosomal protein N' (replication factor Y)